MAPYSDVIMGVMVSHQPHNCLLNRLFRRRSKKTSKLCVTGLCAGNLPVTGEFPAQMASNAENDSIWWRHQVMSTTYGVAVTENITIILVRKIIIMAHFTTNFSTLIQMWRAVCFAVVLSLVFTSVQSFAHGTTVQWSCRNDVMTYWHPFVWSLVDFLHKGQVTRSFGVLFDVRLNKLLRLSSRKTSKFHVTGAWTNNRVTGNLIRCDVNVMSL